MHELTLDEAIERIIELHTVHNAVWRKVGGYAPKKAAELLEKSRLDWLVSLAHSLKLWAERNVSEVEHDGRLILAWANLGALVEGAMKFLLSIYARDVDHAIATKHTATNSRPVKRLRDQNESVAKLQFEDLRQFFDLEDILQKEEWGEFVQLVQNRRNVIHAYADREIGDFDEFANAVIRYAKFLEAIDRRLPEPPSYDY